LSAPKITDRLYASQVDFKTDTPGVYRRGSTYRVLTRPDGGRKVMHRFDTYEEAVAFKRTTPSRAPNGTRYSFVPKETGRLRRRYMDALRRDPCAYCGFLSGVVDHIVPVAGGGPDHWANYTAACSECNGRKSAKRLLIFLAYENGCWEQHAPRRQ
jgi:5-methylcytosine-specific restriction endonuclease McrA